MVSSVAGQGLTPDGATAAPSIFNQTPVTSLVGGVLYVDKTVLSARTKAAPCVSADDNGLFAQLMAAIRRFLGSLFRAILSGKLFGSEGGDNSRQGGGVTAPADGTKAKTPTVSENDRSVAVDGLPEAALDRIRRMIDEMVNVAVGDGLPNSLKTALGMADLGRRQAFRVLLQQNLGDTRQVREVRAELRARIEEMVEPFASQHGIDKTTALALFRADLDSGVGVIAKRVDPDSEIRGHVAELQRLESALAALAKARGAISAQAIEAGAYTRDELAAVVAAQGLDTEFLFKAEAAASESIGANCDAASQSPAPEAAALSPEMTVAVRVLVEQGVIGQNSVQAIVQSVIVDAVLSAESEFELEVDGHGDDLGGILKNSNAAKSVPKL